MSKTSTRLAFKYWCVRPLSHALSFLISLSACSEGIDPREGEPTPFEMADGSMRPSAGGANPIPWEMRGGEEPPVGGEADAGGLHNRSLDLLEYPGTGTGTGRHAYM